MIRKLYFLFLFLVSIVSGYAQHRYTVEHYTSENGLPQNSIKSISIDSYGFIWLATEDGLVRFDGHHFYVFNHFNLPVIVNRVYSIQPSLRDTGSSSTGRNKVSYAIFEGTEFIKIENGTAVLDSNYSINRQSRSQRNSKVFPHIFEGKAVPDILGVGDGISQYMLFTGSSVNNFYVCEKNRISYFRQWKKKSQLQFSVKNLWNYFTLGERLYYYHGNGSITTIIKDKTRTSTVSGDILNDPLYAAFPKKSQLYWSSNADQAFLVLEKNLYKLEPQPDDKLVTRLLINDFDFVARGIEFVQFDQISQKLYLGSPTQGLFVLTTHQFQPITIRGNQRENAFYAQLVYSSNSIVTPNGNIIGKNPATGQTIDEQLPAIRKINQDDPRISMRDNRGTIWLRSSNQLFHLDSKNEKVIDQWKFEITPNKIDNIEGIHQIKSGPIWVGVANQGLYKIDPGLVHARPEFFLKDTQLNITCLQSQTDDVLLVGTRTGLYRFSIASKKATLIEETKGIYIKSIHVFNKNLIWLTALDKGLMLINGKEQVITFPLDKNAYLASPHCIINDKRGFFWVPTNLGLFQIAIQDLLQYAARQSAERSHQPLLSKDETPSIDLFYLYHTMDEGFNTNEFNGSCQPCAVQLPNGYISLPSLVGLVWFKPENIRNYTPNAPIVLDKVELNHRQMNLAGDTLRFPANPENIRLFFATPYAGNDYNLNLSYALVKQFTVVKSSDWIPLDNEDFSIRYSSLKSGNYTLLIRKLNGFGPTIYTIKKVYVMVPPLWYETGWAIASYTGLLLAAIYFYNSYRLKNIKGENARLEDIVTSRTQSLNATLQKLSVAHKELEESENKMVEQVHVMSRLMASITHDIQSPLRYMVFATEEIPQLIREGNLEEAANVGMVVSASSSQMSTMLKDLLDYVKIQVYGKSIQWVTIDLHALIEKKLAIFNPIIERNGNRFLNQVSPQLQVFSDYQLLSIVLHNLLDNAAKYTHHGIVRIYSQIDANGQVELVISNSGTEISMEVLEIINQSGQREKVDPTRKKGRATGLGLLIAKEVSHLLHIDLKITQTQEINFHLIFNPMKG